MMHVVDVGLTPPPDTVVGEALEVRHGLEEKIDGLIEGARSTGGGMMLDGSWVDVHFELDEAVVVPGLLTLVTGLLPEGWTMERVSVRPDEEESDASA